jgi:hypothetical protein
MLTYARRTLLAAVEGLSRDELDHLHDARSNTIGALLAWSPALDLGEQGRREIRGRELESYVDELTRTRQITLAALAGRDDAWLEDPLAAAPELNAHWAWFHVAEDEISHRGQIRWFHARLH